MAVNKVKDNRKKKKAEKKQDVVVDANKEKIVEIEGFGVDDELKELLAPDGLNGLNNSYLQINDAGNMVYIRTFYISRLPRVTNFASTFYSIVNTPGIAFSAFVEPMTEGKAVKSLDNDVRKLETEDIQARKAGDTNQQRKIGAKFSRTSEWANRVESGITSLFEVAFMISMYASSVDELNKMSQDLYYKAVAKNIEISNCYGFQRQAYLANQPLNRAKDFVTSSIDLARPTGLVYHRMDTNSLASIYNHVFSEFYHENGIYLGYNLSDYSPLIHDLYDKTHQGYGVVIAGSTGSGKSVTVKIYVSRWIPEGYRFVMLDSEALGNAGEYSNMTRELGGVNYQISSRSKNTLNIFDISEEEEINQDTKELFMTLKMNEKITNVSNIVQSIIERGDRERLNGQDILVSTIIKRAVKELYDDIGVIEGNANSIYETSDKVYSKGKIGSGRVKKEMPTLTDLYVRVIRHRHSRFEENYGLAYTLVLAALEDYVKDVTVCQYCGTRYQGEATEDLPKCACGKDYVRVRGTNTYFDGASTIEIDMDTPITNIDISQLPESEKPIAQEIALSFIKENFMKKNSVVPEKAMKLGVIYDELHKLLPYESARRLAIDTYRTGRKRFISPITATQSIGDYALYDEETLAMVKNSSTQFIMAHKTLDKKALASTTILSQAQIEACISHEKGECFLIDGNSVVHAKIDYMNEIEAVFAETDMSNMKERPAG